MVTKHFFKVLTIFASMIILGIIVLLATDYFGEQAVQATDTDDQVQVAK
ncbi:MAG: hypothetical protein PHT16_00080 [Candidatus Pacebacteria bacterium]|nr:hypothetical protein [Candidatus Paceibacterota bacterium]